MNKNIKPIQSGYGSSRRYEPKQQENQESALDYFKKNAWDKRDAFVNAEPITSDQYLRNLSVKNTYGIQTSNTYRNEVKENELKTLMNSDINTVKIITNTGDIEVSVSACNRVQALQNATNKLEYANCTKIVDVSDKYEHSMRVRNGYKVYDLYRHSFVANRDLKEFSICVK